MNSLPFYLKFVQWSEEDKAFVGYCPDIFPWGGVCHGSEETAVYAELCGLVEEEVQRLGEGGGTLPPPTVRPMRDALAEGMSVSHRQNAA